MNKRIVPIVLLIFLSLVAMMVSCDDTPATNVTRVAPSGGDYTTIQAALDEAEEGSTIMVEPATYTGNLIIDKPVTLKAGAQGVLIDGSVHINAKNVTFSGFKLIPTLNHGIVGYPDTRLLSIYVDSTAEVAFENLHINGGDSTSANLSYKRGIVAKAGAEFTVSNSLFQNLITAIFVNLDTAGPTGVTMVAQNNTFTNNKAGIGGTEYSNVTILNNTFESLGRIDGEGIGLGFGVTILDTEGDEIADASELEGANTFNYSSGNKVEDYR
ncbi:MAG: hypothetical protein RBR15_04430 [Sphaerochaeta sp.]|nr:hypothetical protein [Sphaerochaeta sp.]